MAAVLNFSNNIFELSVKSEQSWKVKFLTVGSWFKIKILLYLSFVDWMLVSRSLGDAR